MIAPPGFLHRAEEEFTRGKKDDLLHQIRIPKLEMASCGASHGRMHTEITETKPFPVFSVRLVPWLVLSSSGSNIGIEAKG